MGRNVPLCFLKIIVFLYLNMKSRCQWRGSFSTYFDVLTGTKQGGVISPRIFNLYMDDLIALLRKRGIGCHIIDIFIACLFYADDLCLIAPTRSAMQAMLDICQQYCSESCLAFNVKKSKILFFGKAKTDQIQILTLNNKPLEFVSQWKYLGVTLVHGPRFGCCIEETLCKFYRALNSILRINGRSDDLVMLRLIESHCISILSYAIEVLRVADRKQRSKMRVSYNSAFRKLFNYSWRESVTNLQHSLGRLTWEELIEKRKNKFMSKIALFPADSLTRIVGH